MARSKKAGQAVVRAETGQFVQGHSGNPSGLPVDGLRSKQKIIVLKESLELAVRQSGPLTARRVCNILSKMVDMAEAGDVKAAKLVLLLALTGAGSSDDKASTPAAIKIVVENATFKSAAVVDTITPSVRVTNAIDGEFTEIKHG